MAMNPSAFASPTSTPFAWPMKCTPPAPGADGSERYFFSHDAGRPAREIAGEGAADGGSEESIFAFDEEVAEPDSTALSKKVAVPAGPSAPPDEDEEEEELDVKKRKPTLSDLFFLGP